MDEGTIETGLSWVGREPADAGVLQGAGLPGRKVEPIAPELPPKDLLTDTILFACVSDPAYLTDALGRLREDDWPLGWQRAVWRAMARLQATGKPANVVTLRGRLHPYERDLLNRACAEALNPYLADYVDCLTRIGAGRRAMCEATQSAAEAMAAGMEASYA